MKTTYKYRISERKIKQTAIYKDALSKCPVNQYAETTSQIL